MAETQTALSELEQTALAYFTAVTANDIVIAGRFYPYGELVLIIEDKISIAMRKFGLKARGTAKPVAKAFIATMLERGGWSTKQNEYGGSMHQFQPDAFKAALKELQANDPLIQASHGQGPEFWTDKFSALAAS